MSLRSRSKAVIANGPVDDHARHPDLPRIGEHQLAGGGMMVNAVGLLKEWSGSYGIAMLPLVALTLAGAISVLVISRSHAREAAAAAVAA